MQLARAQSVQTIRRRRPNPKIAIRGRQQRAGEVPGQPILRRDGRHHAVPPQHQPIVMSPNPNAALRIRHHGHRVVDGPAIRGTQHTPAAASLPGHYAAPCHRPQSAVLVLANRTHRLERKPGRDLLRFHDAWPKPVQSAPPRAHPQASFTILRQTENLAMRHRHRDERLVLPSKQPMPGRADPQPARAILERHRRIRAVVRRKLPEEHQATALAKLHHLPARTNPDAAGLRRRQALHTRHCLQRDKFSGAKNSNPVPRREPQLPARIARKLKGASRRQPFVRAEVGHLTVADSDDPAWNGSIRRPQISLPILDGRHRARID